MDIKTWPVILPAPSVNYIWASICYVNTSMIGIDILMSDEETEDEIIPSEDGIDKDEEAMDS